MYCFIRDFSYEDTIDECLEENAETDSQALVFRNTVATWYYLFIYYMIFLYKSL